MEIKSAIEALEDAIVVLDESPLSNRLLETDGPSVQQQKLAFQLADCLLRGNYWRLDQFPEALAAFTRGRTIEESKKLEVPRVSRKRDDDGRHRERAYSYNAVTSMITTRTDLFFGRDRSP